jgi:class 3 adenylate cyclase
VSISVTRQEFQEMRDGSMPEDGGDELRPVTALFADIVGSTQLGERLAPEEVKALVGECVSRMSAAVEEFGGTVQAYLGDGICAYFGVPRAHENDAEHAAHAALRIVEVVTRYAHDVESAWGVRDFDVRVGINGGRVAVGPVGSAEPATVALGDATNLASRLQTAARPGTILVGEATATRIGHRFVLEPAGRLTVKGREQEVETYVLAGVHATEQRSARTGLAGRRREMALLRAMVRELEAGRGQVLLLSGDAGIGKSRLLAELRGIAADRVVWLQGHCPSYRGVPFAPFVEALRRWLDVDDRDATITVRTRARARFGALFDDRSLEEVLMAFDRVLRSAAGELVERRSSDRDTLASGLRRAYVDWLGALAAEAPLVLALEDVDWADAATLALAEDVLALTDREPLLVVATLRVYPSSAGARLRLHALGNYAHRALELPLEPLSEAESEELLEKLVPGLDPRTREELVAHGEGNPLYLEELVSALSESLAARRHGTWTIEVGAPPVLPSSLEGLLLGLLDALPESARRLAQTAAVVGRTFPLPVLERLHHADSLETDLTALLRMQYVLELRRYPDREYTFKHALLQEAVLSTLPARRRRALYVRVGEIFEELYPDQLERLAHYYAQGGKESKALEFLEAAGSRAAELGAPVDALEHLGRAQRIAAGLGDAAAEARIAAQLPGLEAAAGALLDDADGDHERSGFATP